MSKTESRGVGNPWMRKWFWYEVTTVNSCGFYVMTRKRKLSFLAYHLIKKIHGVEKLIEIANGKIR